MANINCRLPMNLTSIITQSILIFIVFLIAVLLYALPAGKKSQNSPLCLFLFIVGIHILIDLTFDHPIFNSLKIHLLPSVLIFLYAPLLFLHINSIIGNKTSKKWIHYLLVGIAMIYYGIDGFSNTLFFPVYGLQYLIYAIFITRRINRKKSLNIQAKIWSYFLVYSFGLIWLFAFAANIFGLLDMATEADNVELVSFLAAIIFFIGLVYFTMSQPNLFMNVRISKSNQDLHTTKLSSRDQQRIDQIKRLFVEDKIFTKPDLNREILAGKLGIDTQQCSKEINQYFKMNLSELINHYRIQEAQRILREDSLNIKEIYYQVGFNSRSAFNTAFKKTTGKTPSEYKKTE